jgi:hypothetical protein
MAPIVDFQEPPSIAAGSLSSIISSSPSASPPHVVPIHFSSLATVPQGRDVKDATKHDSRWLCLRRTKDQQQASDDLLDARSSNISAGTVQRKVDCLLL